LTEKQLRREHEQLDDRNGVSAEGRAMTSYAYHHVYAGELSGRPHITTKMHEGLGSPYPGLIVAEDLTPHGLHRLWPVVTITKDYSWLWWTGYDTTTDPEWRPPDGPGARDAVLHYRYFSVFRQGQVVTSFPDDVGSFVVAANYNCDIVLPVLNITDDLRRLW
jgi:hypothetical protein